MMVFRLALSGLLMLSALYADIFYLPATIEKELTQNYGIDAVKRAHALVDLMNRLKDKDEKTKLFEVNNFFNAVPTASDMTVWKRSDYWANRMEFIGKNRGDCEDYTYAKYFTLKQLGIDPKKMYAYYCNSLTYSQPHMVLAYFKDGKKIPFILDNYNRNILPADKRKDLQAIKMYTHEALYLAKVKKMGKTVPGAEDDALVWLELINGIRSK